MDAEQEDKIVGREPSDLEHAEVYAVTMVDEAGTGAVPWAVGAAVGTEHEMVIFEMLTRGAAGDLAPVAVASDDLVAKLDLPGLGRVVGWMKWTRMISKTLQVGVRGFFRDRRQRSSAR
jgi:hypothetical protein